MRDLTDEEVTSLRNYIDQNVEVEGDLRRERTQAIERLPRSARIAGCATVAAFRSAGSGRRPTARTRKGPKKTVGRGKKAKA